MKNIRQIYEKAAYLMEEALKKYNSGDYAAGDKKRQESNKLYEMASRPSCSKDDILYGKCKNFGIIYNVFENNTEKLFKTKRGRKAIADIMKLIMENDTLKTEHSIYNLFNSIDSTLNEKVGIEKYVGRLIEAIKPFSAKTLADDNGKLIALFRKYKLNEMVDIDDDTMDFYNAVEYLITHKPVIQNAKKIMESTNIIEEHLKKNITVKPILENVSVDDIVEVLENKYNYTLNEDERRLLDMITENEDTEKTFNDYRQKIIEKINRIADDSQDNTVKSELNGIIENIKKINYTKDNVVDDMVKLAKVEDKLND